MEKFKVKTSSTGIYLATVVTITLFGLFIALYILPAKNAPALSIIVVIAFGYIAFYLAALIATGVTEWTISEKNIHLKWLSHDIFSRKPDKNFSWSDIEQYKYEPDPNGDLSA